MTGPNPTDRGKSGTKRHVLVDQKGIPLSVTITGANIHDMKASTDTLDKIVVERPVKKHIHLCLDKGYDLPEIERQFQPESPPIIQSAAVSRRCAKTGNAR